MNIGSPDNIKQLFTLKLSVMAALNEEYLIKFDDDFFTHNLFHGYGSSVTIPDVRENVNITIDSRDFSHDRFDAFFAGRYAPLMRDIYELKRKISASYTFFNALQFFGNRNAEREEMQQTITEKCIMITAIIYHTLREKGLSNDDLDIQFIEQNSYFRLVIAFPSLSEKSIKTLSALLSTTKFEPRITEIPKLVING